MATLLFRFQENATDEELELMGEEIEKVSGTLHFMNMFSDRLITFNVFIEDGEVLYEEVEDEENNTEYTKDPWRCD